MVFLANIADWIRELDIFKLGRTGSFFGVFDGNSSSGSSRKKSKKKRVRSIKHRRTRASSRKARHRRTPHTAGKRRDTSHRRIRQTKNGQPYIILASGKARFISKKSARTSRKRKGGKY